MITRALTHAQWFSHVNAINPPLALRTWLTGGGSLTARLQMRCAHFRVQRLHQSQSSSLPDEFAEIKLTRASRVWEREVLLRCDGAPVVFAHTVVPLTANASDWPLFSALGERSLGTTLFGDPQVRRNELQFARIRSGHPLMRRVRRASGIELTEPTLYARRCLYRRQRGLLLVTEIFLPAIADLT